MERLTEKYRAWSCEEFCCGDSPGMDYIDSLYVKLQEYEDTGLQPKEIEQTNCNKSLVLDFSNISKDDYNKLCANLKTQNGRMLADTIIPMNVDDVWVSTKDRLPDKHDMYIVAWTDETIPTPPNEIHFYEMLEFDKDGWDFFDTVLDENSTVIAWQPLPKPYCEVKK